MSVAFEPGSAPAVASSGLEFCAALVPDPSSGGLSSVVWYAYRLRSAQAGPLRRWSDLAGGMVHGAGGEANLSGWAVYAPKLGAPSTNGSSDTVRFGFAPDLPACLLTLTALAPAADRAPHHARGSCDQRRVRPTGSIGLTVGRNSG